MREQTQNPKVLILGGGYAGMIAAARIARSSAPAEVTLIDARTEMVQRIRLHETIAGGVPKTLEYAPLLAKRGVRFLQATVETLEPWRQRVAVRTPDGRRRELEYDKLVLALGSRTSAPCPGVAEHAVRLDDPAALREAYGRLRELAASNGQVLIVGGGLSGVEAAAELAERLPGLRITLATRGRLSEGWHASAADHFYRRLEELGVQVREGVAVEALEAGRAVVSQGEAIPFDLAVWAGGFEALPLAREAGLPVDAAGRVRVAGTLQVPGRPEIFVAGDAAAADGPGGIIRMGCVSALPMGAHAGENVARALAGQELKPFPFAILIRCVSLGRSDGLVQFTNADDTPVARVWTRRLGALVKEMICKMTYWVVKGELSLGVRLYSWAGSPASPSPAPRTATEGSR